MCFLNYTFNTNLLLYQKSSSTADSGQNTSRPEIRIQQGPLASCLGQETSNQVRNGMKKRRQFYQDIG